MTERGCTPRKDQRPTRWPPSADSSRNDGPEPRSFRYADTGVSVSAMKVWRSGTSECSPASARASSSVGRMCSASAATGIQNLERIRERKITRCQQDGQVVEHIGRFLGHALVRLFASGPRDLFGLLLDLLTDERRIGKQLHRPRALARLRLARGDDALQRWQRFVRGRLGVAL